DRLGRDDPGPAIGARKEQAVSRRAPDAAPAAVTAEVDHRRPEPAQLAKQIEWLHRPPGLELEAVPVAAALQLHLDRAHLPIECEPIGIAWIGGQKQDRVLLHRYLGAMLGADQPIAGATGPERIRQRSFRCGQKPMRSWSKAGES